MNACVRNLIFWAFTVENQWGIFHIIRNNKQIIINKYLKFLTFWTNNNAKSKVTIFWLKTVSKCFCSCCQSFDIYHNNHHPLISFSSSSLWIFLILSFNNKSNNDRNVNVSQERIRLLLCVSLVWWNELEILFQWSK